MQLKVGGVYRARNGYRKGPMSNHGKDRFTDGEGLWNKNGTPYYIAAETTDSPTLIAEWKDAPTDEPEVGKWIRWDGGERPVHPETVVNGVEDNGARWPNLAAKYCDWQSFRGCYQIITPYVEPPKPREYTIDPTGLTIWFEPSDGLIHVREVLPDDE